MAAMTRDHVRKAQAELRGHLVRLFGPNLDGVSGFGAELDRETRQLALSVQVDGSAWAARATQEQLPPDIGGLRVKVGQGGVAIAD